MSPSLHRLLGGGALAVGAVTLGLAAGGVAAVDSDLAAATRPAPPVRDGFVDYRPSDPRAHDCPGRRAAPSTDFVPRRVVEPSFPGSTPEWGGGGASLGREL